MGVRFGRSRNREKEARGDPLLAPSSWKVSCQGQRKGVPITVPPGQGSTQPQGWSLSSCIPALQGYKHPHL